MADIANMVEELSKLTVIEAAELVKQLETKWGVSAAAPVAAAAAGALAGGAAAAPAAEAKIAFDVILASVPADKKISVIKAVREVKAGLGLAEAKALVEGAPKPVLEGANKADADTAKKKLEEAGVKLVAARLGGGVDLRRTPAVFRRVDASEDLKLLQGFDGRPDNVTVEIDIRVLHAIEREVIVHAALSGQRDVLPGAGSALAGVGLSRIGETKTDVGAQRDELQEITAVQRQLHNALILDHGAHRRVLGRQQTRRSGDFHDFRNLPYLQRKVDSRGLLHLQLEIGTSHALEAFHRYFDFVDAGLQGRKAVDTRVVGKYSPGSRIGLVDDGDRGAHDNAATGISKLPSDLTRCLARHRC